MLFSSLSCRLSASRLLALPLAALPLTLLSVYSQFAQAQQTTPDDVEKVVPATVKPAPAQVPASIQKVEISGAKGYDDGGEPAPDAAHL